ncbi:MAG: hypothetical protein RL071_832 [Pseudomonadota bacterium]
MPAPDQRPSPTIAERRGALLFALCCSTIALLALNDGEQRQEQARLVARAARPVTTRTGGPDAPEPGSGVEAPPVVADRTVPGELMLSFAPGVDVDAFAAEHGLEVRGRPMRGGLHLLGRAGADEGALLAQLSDDPRVLAADLNGVIYGAGHAYAGLQTHRAEVRAWGELGDSREVHVAVVDSGVALHNSGCTPPRIIGGVRGDSAWDFVDNDRCAFDGNQHGTHIASTIASYDNEVLGVAPGVRILSYRVLDANNRGSEWALVQALWAIEDDDIDVVNLSLTFAPGFVPSDDLRWAIDAVADAGKPMIAAAGNNGLPEVGWPAAHPEVIAVGSVCRTAGGAWERAPYSNYGPQIDVVAPGGCLDRDVDRNGYVDGILAASIGVKDAGSTGWWWMAGTSQAAAVVTGAVANLVAQGLEPELARYALHRGAVPISSAQWADGNGAGVVDLTRTSDQAWGAPWSGHDYWAHFQVAMLPLLQDMGDGTVRPRAELSVLDESGAGVPGVKVVGAFTGATGGGFACTTDAQGRCVAQGPAVASSSTAAQSWTVQVARVVDPAGFAVPARAVLFVDDDLQAIYAALHASGRGDALLAYEWANETTGGVRIRASYTLSNSGTGISTSPFGLILTPPALDRVAGLGTPATVNARLSRLDGSGISTSPFGLRVVTLDAGGQLVALDGSGISTSPFGARTVQLPDTAACSACVIRTSLMADLETAEVAGASAAVRGWSVNGKLAAGGWINSLGASSADAVAASLVSQAPVPMAASMPSIRFR